MKKLTTLLLIINTFFAVSMKHSYAVPQVIHNYKFTLGIGAISHTALAYQAFQIYKSEALKKKKIWSFTDFLQKYPQIYADALFASNNKKTKPEKAQFNNFTKIAAATTGTIFCLELLKNIGKNNKPPRPPRPPQPGVFVPFVQPINNDQTIKDRSLAFNKWEPKKVIIIQEKDGWGYINKEKPINPALLAEYKSGKIIEHKTQAKDTNAKLQAEREAEEKALQRGEVLLEQHTGCLFCHAPFEDGETGYFYGCCPTHLYHEGCIKPWEESKNNGYAGGATHCHYDCDKQQNFDYNYDYNNVKQLYSISVKLRATACPGHVPFKEVDADGVLLDPCDDKGTLVEECACCDKLFKSGDEVAFAALDPKCSSNHTVHKTCLDHFRRTLGGEAPKARGGYCYEGRGLSCPFGCADPILPNREYGKRTTHDHAYVTATIKFTKEPVKIKKLFIEKKTIKPLPANKHLTCEGCGNKSDTHKGRHWTTYICQCGEEYSYCDEAHEADRSDETACLRPAQQCVNCYIPFPADVYKNGTWYAN